MEGDAPTLRERSEAPQYPGSPSPVTMKDQATLPSLSIVVPCYNEQEVLSETCRRLSALLDDLSRSSKISVSSYILFVDDGSRDRTWPLIQQLSTADPRVRGIKLSRNRGHQNALVAGLFHAEADAIASIDADLQDDVRAIGEMVDRFSEGADIVYGVRRKRETDTAFKRLTARTFYAIMRMLGVESVSDHADYRLMSRRAIDSLKTYREVNLYLRGIVPLLGFRSELVYYDRAKRFAGTSKYPLRKMIALALEAITSFSVVPLRVITLLGFTLFAATILVSAWALWVRFISHNAVPGWTSLVLPMYLLGGIQIFCLGMIGEYLGKVYSEVKNRPRYIIEELTARPEGDVRKFRSEHDQAIS